MIVLKPNKQNLCICILLITIVLILYFATNIPKLQFVTDYSFKIKVNIC